MPATLANTFCSFNKIVQQQISGLVVDLWCAWLQLISACNSERIIEIGQCLPKLCANKKGPVSLTQAYTGLPISTSWRDVSCGWRYLSRLDLLTGRRSAFVRYSRNESRNECGHPLPKKLSRTFRAFFAYFKFQSAIMNWLKQDIHARTDLVKKTSAVCGVAV